jgi:hypothetical protein
LKAIHIPLRWNLEQQAGEAKVEIGQTPGVSKTPEVFLPFNHLQNTIDGI